MSRSVLSRLYAFIDFEYNGTKEEKLNLVSCAIRVKDNRKSYWLLDGSGLFDLLADIAKIDQAGGIFVCFNGVAEGSAFYALGLNPTAYKWIDLQAEWKMLLNHNYEFAYGKQLIKGRVVTTSPPDFRKKWAEEDDEDDAINHAKAERNLAAMAFKLTGQKVDTAQKTAVRNLIIYGSNAEIEARKGEILAYNLSDIDVLPDILTRVLTYYQSSEPEILFSHLLNRGQTGVETAILTCYGYPVNGEQVRRFAENVPAILREIQEDINEQFPDHKFFERNKDGTYTMKQKPLRNWIENESGVNPRDWIKTATGEFSLSLDAFEKFFTYRHNYPRGNVGAQIVRFLKTKQSLNGFLPKKKGETFFDSLGSDNRVRSYLNPYGSQSARFQPKATSFIFLKASWTRSLVQPPPGFGICGIDFVSEEFLLGACWAVDENMWAAYESGDVYLYFGKLAGAIPWDGTKAEYKELRDLFKSTVLGISYNMGAQGLANKLTQDLGRKVEVEEAQDLIFKFKEAFSAYAEKVEATRYEYIQRGYLQLADGWVLWGDNPNYRSVCNFPVQGGGSVVLRRAISGALARGLKVIVPLHDAAYQEFRSDELHRIDELAFEMKKAFVSIFEGRAREMAESIRLDVNVWGPDFREGQVVTPGGIVAKSQTIYIDERSKEDYARFKKYF